MPKSRRSSPSSSIIWRSSRRRTNNNERRSVAFVRKPFDGADAFAQRLEQCVAPANRSKRRCFLIGLLVGLGEKTHRQPVPFREFAHRYSKLDASIAL